MIATSDFATTGSAAEEVSPGEAESCTKIRHDQLLQLRDNILCTRLRFLRRMEFIRLPTICCTSLLVHNGVPRTVSKTSLDQLDSSKSVSSGSMAVPTCTRLARQRCLTRRSKRGPESW